MRVIPVIDLMRGEVVRGVGGKRDQYRPIQSRLCEGSSPKAVGDAFRRLGFCEVYVADLDAIGGAEPDWTSYGALIGCGMKLWGDAGAAGPPALTKMMGYRHGGRCLDTLIVGLESLVDSGLLAESVALVGATRLVFSLDLRRGRPIVGCRQWRKLPAEKIAEEAVGMGIQRMIVLDLARVGVDGGVGTLDLCRRLRREFPALEITSGGGVRSLDDLRLLADAGCDAALVASALHDGRIAAEDAIKATTDGHGRGRQKR
ncbi:MAG TPA: HisA/HisF-related TIM barrel protein [Pirellulales bacterium]|nr:HisA/HisF-related TIM barrel protein [Pirellulales bacterium]